MPSSGASPTRALTPLLVVLLAASRALSGSAWTAGAGTAHEAVGGCDGSCLASPTADLRLREAVGPSAKVRRDIGMGSLTLLQSSYTTRQIVVSEDSGAGVGAAEEGKTKELAGQMPGVGRWHRISSAYVAAASASSFAISLVERAAHSARAFHANIKDTYLYVGLAVGLGVITLISLVVLTVGVPEAEQPAQNSIGNPLLATRRSNSSMLSTSNRKSDGVPSPPMHSPGSSRGLPPYLQPHGPTSFDAGSPMAPTHNGEYFCPDLVVPHSCECVLLIPIRPLSGSFDVADMNGNVVLHVAPQEGGPTQSSFRGGSTPGASSARMSSAALAGRSGGSAIFGQGGKGGVGALRRLMLTTSYGEVLAQCCAARPSSPPGVRGPAEFHLLRAGGDFFANLIRTEDQERYMLSTVSGLSRLFFWGAFENHAVNITDDSGKLLATTEPCTVDFNKTDEYYRLRVAPLMDVGLILCGLLSIDHLD